MNIGLFALKFLHILTNEKKILNIFLTNLFLLLSLTKSFSNETTCLENKIFVENNITFLLENKKPFSGKNICLYESGNIKIESIYINGLVEGVSKSWHDQKDSMASLSFFVNGKKQGIEKRWSINGQLTKEINYLDDKNQKNNLN